MNAFYEAGQTKGTKSGYYNREQKLPELPPLEPYESGNSFFPKPRREYEPHPVVVFGAVICIFAIALLVLMAWPELPNR